MVILDSIRYWYRRNIWKAEMAVGTLRERLRRRPVAKDKPIPFPNAKDSYYVTRRLAQDCVKIGRKSMGKPRFEPEECREAQAREEDPEES